MWLSGLYYGALCSLSSVFFYVVFSIVVTSLGEVYFSCICLFILHAFLSSSLCQGLAAACDCGTPWSFFYFLLLLINLFWNLKSSGKAPALNKYYLSTDS